MVDETLNFVSSVAASAQDEKSVESGSLPDGCQTARVGEAGSVIAPIRSATSTRGRSLSRAAQVIGPTPLGVQPCFFWKASTAWRVFTPK